MLIKRIDILKLYGRKDYRIEFDSKLTFLYGANGCGKTTVLKILASIVTGKIYNLADYKFSEINLFYLNKKNNEEKIQIEMHENNKDIRNMTLHFDDDNYEICDIDNLKERIFRINDDESIEQTFFNMYPYVKKIINKFNYVYLPLNRYLDGRLYERGYYRYRISRRNYYGFQHVSDNSYLNESLERVSELIRNEYMGIFASENKVNDTFRKDVLSQMICVSGDMDISKIIDETTTLKWDEVLKLKDVYEKTLQEIGVYDKNLERKITDFFESFEKAYNEYAKQNNEKIKVNLAWKYGEFSKIRKITELAKKNEERKEKIRQPKKIFEELINDFFQSNGSNKEIEVTNKGKVEIKTPEDKLTLIDLSSGEKQIIITFASLIFGFKSKGIFIVDEPEASLHLEWQNKFVPAILKAKEDIQLIFATHSPELIGKYRENAVKLK